MGLDDSLKGPGLTELKAMGMRFIYLKLQVCEIYLGNILRQNVPENNKKKKKFEDFVVNTWIANCD